MPHPLPLQLHALEDRCLPAPFVTGTPPVAVDSVLFDPDSGAFVLQSSININGRGEALAVGSDYWSTNSNWNQPEGFIEFDLGLGGGPEPDAEVTVLLPDVGGRSGDNPTNMIAVSWYAGDGEVTVGDRSAESSPLTTLTTRAGQFGEPYSVDVTEAVRQIRQSGGQFLGLRVKATLASDFESFGVADSFNPNIVPVLARPADLMVGEPAWNENRGPIESGDPERGFDFTISTDIGVFPDPEAVTVAYYWSVDESYDPNDTPVGSRQDYTASELDAVGGRVNEPARWGVRPPPGTRYLLIRVDPDDNIPESDETNNVAALRIHTPAEVLNGAVRPERTDAITMEAGFVPGRLAAGGPFTLSEAEVVLGVDHFNWGQNLHGPGNWEFQLWRGVTDYAANGAPANGTQLAAAFEAVDPVIRRDESDRYFIRVDRLTLADTVRYFDVFQPTDSFAPYLNETPAQWQTNDAPGGTVSPTQLRFSDDPKVPDWSYSGRGDHFLTFTTTLIGVGPAPGYAVIPLGDNRTSFTWKSNTIVDGRGVVSGGGVRYRGQTFPDSTFVAPNVAGGVFGVTLGDGTPIAGFPIEAPPLPGDGSLRPPVLVGGAANGSAGAFSPNPSGTIPATPGATVSPFGLNFANVRVATGDVNGDGTFDMILVTGPGTPIRVAVVSGTDSTTLLVSPFDPFGGDFTGGGFVAAADLDGDGRAEFVVTPDQGGGPRVSIFSLLASGQLQTKANFLGIDDANFRGGARPALGDVDGDGVPDLLVAAGFGGGPRVALFDGENLFSTKTKLVNDFFAFPDDASTLRNGIFAALGDISGDGFADLVFGGGPGGAPRVYILSGQFLMSGNPNLFSQPVANFFVAGNSSDRGGVRLAVKDADGDAKADLVVGSGEGSPAKVRIYLGDNFTSTGEPGTFQDLNVFGGVPLIDGVFVG